jgi:hypothetical protein
MGRAAANIGIDTNDPGQPKVFVRVEGIVRPVLQLVPATLYLEHRDPSSAVEPRPMRGPGTALEQPRDVAVWAWGERPIRVVSVNASVGWLDARFTPNLGPAAAAENLGRIVVRAHDVPKNFDGKAEVEVTARNGDRELHRTLKVLVDVD